jgi:hypothetical protein
MDCAGALEQSIRQRRLAVIDVRYDAKVARLLDSHPESFRDYASAARQGQLTRHFVIPSTSRGISR